MPSSSMPANIEVTPHSAPTDHNQSVPDPIAHFKAIPWCAALLSDPANLQVVVPDRRPLPSGESNFVRKTMNSPTTVRACVTFFRMVRPLKSKPTSSSTSSSSSVPSSGGTREVSPAGGAPAVGSSKEEAGDRGKSKKTKALSASEALLSGGGRENGEDPRNPFLLFSALADLGVDCQSYVGTMHGGLYGVLMDEVMGTAANFQAPHGAYTVSFTTNFRRAVRTPQVVLIRGRVVRKDGRKLYVKGTMEDKDGNIMAEGDGLWLAMNKNVGRSQL
ncbi:Thioesterase/thiol ester dehydrase-isomerase [Hypoxylon crocopeplum]|nr:Thioesterase/thiol ester dehydrase-isomerase [Hypoxylon crocopeplum]